MNNIPPSGDEIKHSLKLNHYFSVPLCEEDLWFIRNFCSALGFSPKPRPVGRSLIRFAFDTVSLGLVTIQSVYKTYNASSVSEARNALDNPARALKHTSTGPLVGRLSPLAAATFEEFGIRRGLDPEQALVEWLELAAHVYSKLGLDYRRRSAETRDELLLREA